MAELDSLDGGEGEPADVVADMDVAPLAYGLDDGHFRALVEGEEFRTAFVGRSLGVDDTAGDDSFATQSVASMKRGGISRSGYADKEGDNRYPEG